MSKYPLASQSVSEPNKPVDTRIVQDLHRLLSIAETLSAAQPAIAEAIAPSVTSMREALDSILPRIVGNIRENTGCHCHGAALCNDMNHKDGDYRQPLKGY